MIWVIVAGIILRFLRGPRSELRFHPIFPIPRACSRLMTPLSRSLCRMNPTDGPPAAEDESDSSEAEKGSDLSMIAIAIIGGLLSSRSPSSALSPFPGIKLPAILIQGSSRRGVRASRIHQDPHGSVVGGAIPGSWSINLPLYTLKRLAPDGACIEGEFANDKWSPPDDAAGTRC